MHWFKTHHGFNSDTKLGLIAHQLKIPRIIVSGIFLDMLEYASKQTPRGSISGYDAEAHAYNLGIATEQVVTVSNALRNRGVISDSEIVNWDKYQSKDRTNAERQARFRNKEKQSLINSVTDSNALRNTEERREDKIREEKKIPPISPKGDSPTPRRLLADSSPQESRENNDSATVKVSGETGQPLTSPPSSSPPYSPPDGFPSDSLSLTPPYIPPIITAREPEWLPIETWNDFKAMRKSIRKPMTSRAEELMFKKLERFHRRGLNVREILEHSILNSWQDVYEPKTDHYGKPTPQQPPKMNVKRI